MGKLGTAVDILRQDGPSGLLRSGRLYLARRTLARVRPHAYESTLATDRFAALRSFVSTPSPVIVDGGANRGQTISAFLETYESPTIHAFEPIPDLADGIEDRYADADVLVHRAALGAEAGTVAVNVAAKPGQSSVLEASDAVDEHGWTRDVTRRIDADLVRVDETVDHVDVLKLDLQGYELEALRGATGLLSDVGAVLTEVEFVPLYEGAPVFRDVTTFLADRGFRLFNLYNLTTDDAGQLMYGDALYVPGEYGAHRDAAGP